MSDAHLYKEISSLPADLKKQVIEFIEFLKSKVKTEPKIKSRKFGSAKDFFKMSPDFDAPLEDFKEYM